MCTIDPKTALIFGGFSQRQSQPITLSGEVRVDLLSMPKFTHQIRRCYSTDALKTCVLSYSMCISMKYGSQKLQHRTCYSANL